MSPRDDEKAGGASADEGVLGNLPSTRPARIGRRREASAAQERPAPAKAAKGPKASKASARRSSPKAAAATPRATAAKPAARRSSPKAASTGPRAVRSGSPSLKQPPKRRRFESSNSPPKGTELVTTAVQAAGELAQIGFTLGGQIVKRAVDRIPKP
jgi:hypothetical protein